MTKDEIADIVTTLSRRLETQQDKIKKQRERIDELEKELERLRGEVHTADAVSDKELPPVSEIRKYQSKNHETIR